MGYFNIYGQYVQDNDELYHHGIKGQEWGVRHGPPYPLGADAHSSAEKRLKSSNAGELESWKKKGTRSNVHISKKARKISKSDDGGAQKSNKTTDDKIVEKMEKVKFFPTKKQHFERNKYMPFNSLPQSPKEAYKSGWDDGVASACHQFTSKSHSNKKFVSPDGKLEVIFDSDGKIVRDPADYGTYNFSSPNKNPLGHFSQDVIPWLVYGNAPDDSTNAAQRLKVFFVDGSVGIVTSAPRKIASKLHRRKKAS